MIPLYLTAAATWARYRTDGCATAHSACSPLARLSTRPAGKSVIAWPYPQLTTEFRKVHQFLSFAVSAPMQHAIADFLREAPGFADGLAPFYQERRDRFVSLLEGSRFGIRRTAGTYFQLADYSAVSDLPDAEFCVELTRRHRVAAIPLSPFCDEPPNARLIRFCLPRTTQLWSGPRVNSPSGDGRE